MCDVVFFRPASRSVLSRGRQFCFRVQFNPPKHLAGTVTSAGKQHHEKQDGSTIRHKREQDPGAAVPVACESFSSGKIYRLLVLRPERCRRRTPRPPPFSSINSTPLRVSAT